MFLGTSNSHQQRYRNENQGDLTVNTSCSSLLMQVLTALKSTDNADKVTEGHSVPQCVGFPGKDR